MRGTIIKGIAGFYEVADANGNIFTCHARGIFRKDGIKPLVGDCVLFSEAETESSEANIEKILPRKNELIRPSVSNIDMAVVVLSVRKPDPQLYLLDKYLVFMEQQNVPAAILFNKTDLDTDDILPEYAAIYENIGYHILFTSAADKRGIEELKNFISGKKVVLAGPSGVGKSSLTNILYPGARMETGEISRKIERGKQTTRHSEFFPVGNDTFLCDTPGFTSVSLIDKEEDLRFFFPEISVREGKCRFTGCRHLSEPGCAVKEAVQNGEIAL